MDKAVDEFLVNLYKKDFCGNPDQRKHVADCVEHFDAMRVMSRAIEKGFIFIDSGGYGKTCYLKKTLTEQGIQYLEDNNLIYNI